MDRNFERAIVIFSFFISEARFEVIKAMKTRQGNVDCDALWWRGRTPTFQRPMLPPLQDGPLKLWYPTTTLHGVTTQKTSN